MKIKILVLLLITIIVVGFFYEKELYIFHEPKNHISDEIKIKIQEQQEKDNQNTALKTLEVKNSNNLDQNSNKDNNGEQKSQENLNNTENLVSKEGNIEKLVLDKNTEVLDIEINTNKKIEEVKIIEKLDIKEEILDSKIDNDFSIKINNTVLSSNIDNIITFSGNNIDEISYINIGEYSYKPQLLDGKLYILTEVDKLLNGTFSVFYQLNSGEIVTSNQAISFKYSDESLLITDITPKNIKNDINRNIIIQGKGFKKIISLQLSNNLVLTDTSFNIINDNVLNVIIPKDLEIGKYTLNLMSTSGIHNSKIQIEINQ